MFDGITIHLDGALCKCTKKKYPSWNMIKKGAEEEIYLRLKCDDCEIILDVPLKCGMTANFSYNLEKEQSKEPTAKILNLVPANKESSDE